MEITGLPNLDDGIAKDVLIACHEWDVFNECLRDQNPIEWVFMVKRQAQKSFYVIKFDRHKLKPVVVYRVLDEIGERLTQQ